MTNKYGDKYRVHDWMKFSYSEIGEYIDENHTDMPLRNDEIVDLLNEQDEQIRELESVIQDIVYETRSTVGKGYGEVCVSVSPQIYERLTELLEEKIKW